MGGAVRGICEGEESAERGGGELVRVRRMGDQQWGGMQGMREGEKSVGREVEMVSGVEKGGGGSYEGNVRR